MKNSRLLAGFGAASLIFAPACKPDYKDNRPNIVFILADDLGYGDLSCLNPDSRIKTPGMDQIAREGLTFTDAHSPSAVSSPTRYGILTGEYCFRTSLKSGVLVGYSPALIAPEKTTVADILKKAGYQTACIGKWHLGLDWSRKDTTLPLTTGDLWNRPNTSNVDYTGPVAGGPADHGFDYSFIIPSSLDITPYCYIRNRNLVAPVTDTIAGSNQPRGVFWRPGDIQDDFRLDNVLETITREANQFIINQSNTNDPFFLYLPLTAPHTPWLPDEAFRGKSRAGIYGDFVSQVDNCIARIMETLKSQKLDENTLVIVTSDNGSNWTPADIKEWGHRSNWIFRGQKSDIWEGGHHIPLLARWPGKIKPGRTSDQLVSLTDLFATCAELTGYNRTPADGPDSYSFLSELYDIRPTTPPRNTAVQHSINGMFAFRSVHWKFIDGKGSGGWSSKGSPEDPPGQLYNLQTDPGETKNLFYVCPDIVRDLQKQLNATKNPFN